MANYANLKTAIQQAIKQNGNEEITGAILQTTLLSMINSLGANYQFAGILTPSTNFVAPDENVFFVGGGGTYNNFGANQIVVPNGSIGIFMYNGTYSSHVIQSNGVLDVSVLNAVNGVPTQYSTLQNALNAIPSNLRYNGMEIIYIDSNTEQYVKYRMIAKEWSVLSSAWQGIDNEPIFGSKNLVTSGGAYEASKSVVDSSNDADADLDVSDETGNVVVRFKNGHIRTKNFNSEDCPQSETYYKGDFAVADENDNILVKFLNGNIKTKNFDSSIVSKFLPNGTIIANEINSIDNLGEPITCLSVTDEGVTTQDNVAMGFVQVLKISDSMYYMYYRAVGTDTIVPAGADLSDEKVIKFAYSRNGFDWFRGFPEGITPPIDGVNCCVFYDTDGETMLIKPSNCIFKAPWDIEYPYRAITSEGAAPVPYVYLFKSRDGVTFVEPKLIDGVVRDTQPSVIVRDGILKIYERLQPSVDGNRYIVVGYYDYDGNVISPFRYLFGSEMYNSAACRLDERRDILFPTYYPKDAGESYKESIQCYIVDGNIVKPVSIDSDVLTENGLYQQIYASPNGLVAIEGKQYLYYVVNDRNHSYVPPLTTPYTGNNEIKMVEVTFGNNINVRQ